MVRPARSALVVVVACSALAGCAVDVATDADAPEERGREANPIVNGQATAEFPTAGILLLDFDPPSLQCSGTLIGCDRFLTAAHCVCDSDGGRCGSPETDQPMEVYLQHAGFFQVTSRHVHPRYSFPDHDVAVLELSRPVTGIVPSPLPDAAPDLGQDGIIVGYGRSGGGVRDYGIKQFGPVVTADCPHDARGPGHVCWDYGGDGANTCNGDSGGPLFVEQERGGLAVAGITSGGTRSDCLAGDHSYDTDVSAHHDFIVDAAGGADRLGQASCGDLPHVGGQGAAVLSHQGALQAEASESHEVEVAAGTAELRVSLNATEGTSPDLYVRAGQEPTATERDCAADGVGSYGFCEIHSPAPGTWHLLVLAGGAGDVQVTSTTLAGAPTAADDSYEVSIGVTFEVSAAQGVLANDVDAGRAPLVAEMVGEPAHGLVELRADGSFVYRAGPRHAGGDSFTYRASDGTYSSVARVQLTVSTRTPPAKDSVDGGEDSDVSGGCAAGGSSVPRGWLLAALALGIAALRRRSRTARR